jgi:hypothetical protein
VIVTEKPDDICHVAAGAVALSEGAVADLDALSGLLRAGGADREDVGRTIRALGPFAESRARPPATPPAPAGGGIRRLFTK